MLYDPKWDEIYTTQSFERWLSSQPKSATYDFTEPRHCAVAQYLRARGVEDVWMPLERMGQLGWTNIVLHGGARNTFGRAARMARIKVGNASLVDRIRHAFD